MYINARIHGHNTVVSVHMHACMHTIMRRHDTTRHELTPILDA